MAYKAIHTRKKKTTVVEYIEAFPVSPSQPSPPEPDFSVDDRARDLAELSWNTFLAKERREKIRAELSRYLKKD